uniref:Uncharacterized protein n=1 Tax=Rhizophora mucronata TaxID=61149 RepID=A0A2P2P3Z9_RHIMU
MHRTALTRLADIIAIQLPPLLHNSIKILNFINYKNIP